MKPLARLLSASALASALLLSALPAQAIGRLVDVHVIDRDSGARLPVYRHQGQWWIAGRPGARYAIELRNASGERLLGVIAVDGVNVISGETAGWDQAGYVLARRQRARITGWRKSDAEVAAFHFTALADSYAARTGRPDDVGVIGVAVFRERRPAPPPPIAVAPTPAWGGQAPAAGEATASAAAPAAEAPLPTPGRAAPAQHDQADVQREQSAQAPATARLGTGHGAREQAWVRHTQFERREAHPAELIAIRYDSRENLLALGVIPADPPVRQQPNPFPATLAGAGYVPDPPR
jgi:hypothetical protein